MTRVFASSCAAVMMSALLLHAQPEELPPAVGRLLVATEDSHDPNFEQTVVLLVQYDEEQGVMGLILNRPTKVEVSRIFRDVPGAKTRQDPVYAGGPVTLSVMALLRAQKTPDRASHVFGSVQVIANKDLLEETVTAGKPPSVFRVYVGYAGWTGPQLRHEIELGYWHVLRATAGLVFDPSPDTEWTRLNRKTLPRARLSDPNSTIGEGHHATNPNSLAAAGAGCHAWGAENAEGNHPGCDAGRGRQTE